MAKSVLF